MIHGIRYVPIFVILLAVLSMHVQMGRWLSASIWCRRAPRRRWTVYAIVCLVGAAVVLSVLFGTPGVAHLFPANPWLTWLRAVAMAWGLLSIGVFLAFFLWRRLPKHNPGRRSLLRLAGGTLLAAPFGATAFGILVERKDLRVREIDIAVSGLPKDLDGLRLVQLSDIHLSPFLSLEELARAVDMANDLRAHLALVTGDLITSRGDPLTLCLHELAKLRAEAGILGCLGNHEGYAHVEDQTTRLGARLGVRFLRGQAQSLRFGAASLNVAGVDHQSYFQPYLQGTAALIDPRSFNLLLSHNPDVFPVAARQGWDLTISGHTHGGQVNVEIFDQPLNVARFYTPYVYGLYKEGAASIYVTRGIGTVGIPARIGAPPEIALIRLRGTDSRPSTARLQAPSQACAT